MFSSDIGSHLRNTLNNSIMSKESLPSFVIPLINFYHLNEVDEFIGLLLKHAMIKRSDFNNSEMAKIILTIIQKPTSAINHYNDLCELFFTECFLGKQEIARQKLYEFLIKNCPDLFSHHFNLFLKNVNHPKYQENFYNIFNFLNHLNPNEVTYLASNVDQNVLKDIIFSFFPLTSLDESAYKHRELEYILKFLKFLPQISPEILDGLYQAVDGYAKLETYSPAVIALFSEIPIDKQRFVSMFKINFVANLHCVRKFFENRGIKLDDDYDICKKSIDLFRPVETVYSPYMPKSIEEAIPCILKIFRQGNESIRVALLMTLNYLPSDMQKDKRILDMVKEIIISRKNIQEVAIAFEFITHHAHCFSGEDIKKLLIGIRQLIKLGGLTCSVTRTNILLCLQAVIAQASASGKKDNARFLVKYIFEYKNIVLTNDQLSQLCEILKATKLDEYSQKLLIKKAKYIIDEILGALNRGAKIIPLVDQLLLIVDHSLDESLPELMNQYLQRVSYIRSPLTYVQLIDHYQLSKADHLPVILEKLIDNTENVSDFVDLRDFSRWVIEHCSVQLLNTMIEEDNSLLFSDSLANGKNLVTAYNSLLNVLIYQRKLFCASQNKRDVEPQIDPLAELIKKDLPNGIDYFKTSFQSLTLFSTSIVNPKKRHVDVGQLQEEIKKLKMDEQPLPSINSLST